MPGEDQSFHNFIFGEVEFHIVPEALERLLE
jgi:hypothetical protein